MWNRREFGLVGWLGLCAPTLEVLASTGSATPEEGFDYQVLNVQAPRMGAQGLEVLEFFRYGCPFCDRFEPMVHRWRETLSADVRFYYVPVSFQSTAHQQLYLTLRALGQAERLHMAVYDAIHRQGQHFEILMEISLWVQRRGVDPAAFEATWHSRGVARAMEQANDVVRAYGVTSVPQFGVAGRYRTSPAMVGGNNERALAVVDHLIERVQVHPESLT